jgi:flagellin-like protein
MKNHSFVRNKRGVSEIIASVVLILIVSSAGVVAYSYSIGAFSSSTSIFQLDTNLKEQQAQERFAITAVWSNPPNQLNLTMFNYGQIGLTVDAVYVNWTPVSTYFAGRRTLFSDGTWIQVAFTSPIAIQSGSIYEIIVVSTRGSTNAIAWRA